MAISLDDDYGPVPWQYNSIAIFLSRIAGIFYREIGVWGLEKIPNTGPIMLVAAPHSNEVCFHPLKVCPNFLQRTIVNRCRSDCLSSLHLLQTSNLVCDRSEIYEKKICWSACSWFALYQNESRLG